jgi:hypothetical protein
VTGNAADLTYSLHPFLQGMHGGDREPPRKPRWRSGLTALAQGRLTQNSGEGVRDAKLQSARTFSRFGVDWTEARILVTLANGISAKEITRATSSPGGTVLVIGQLLGTPDFEPSYDRLAEEILGSFQIDRSH